MTQQYAGMRAILPLFLVIFIDSLGMGIIFPILNPLYMSAHGMLAAGTPEHVRNFLYGFTLCVFPFFLFFGTPVLGDLSDHVGRKKVLVICLVGVGISYIISGISVMIDSVILLIVSRAVAGIFAGSMATAQAAVVDVSHPDKKAVNISRLLLFASLGFVAGPLLGSFLTDSNLVSWFSYWTPLFLAGFLAIGNAILLWFGFHETHEAKGKLTIKIHQAVQIFMDAFRNINIRRLSIMYFFYQLAWSIYFQYISLLMLHRFHYDTLHIGLFMAIIGLGFALGFIYFINLVTKYLSHYQIVLMSVIVAAIGMYAVVLTDIAWVIWVIAFVISMFIAVSYSVIITMYSDQVSDDKQGWVMGVNNAVIGVAWTGTALIAGFLQNISMLAPLTAAAVLMTIALGLMGIVKR
tara:strand:+ start:169 stop:1389 length:1221 start_codon:yes stop_codon:yes gene_type:complete